MELSQVGLIADLMWYEIKNHAQNVELGEFVVMPNHIHGIIILNKHIDSDNLPDMDSTKTIGQQRWQNQGKNTISSIVGSYKAAVTKHANRLGFENGWQAGFHEHIIRNADSFEFIKNYITNNPKNWNSDKFFG